MLYLYTQQIIHGDLATRNCLVSYDLYVKIADLGIGHDLYEQDYYDNGTQLLPIRWMAPELLGNSDVGPAFSLSSDVWSFGVFCWEVFTYGRQPYEELMDEQVLEMVPSGHLLSPPEEGCPPPLYSLMMDCWQESPLNRPDFTEIAPGLHTIETD
jgi:serine/threonine protein kinase